MKRLFLLTGVMILATVSVFAQEKPQSPAATAEGTIDGVKVKIDYHAPSARGRKMLGAHEPYGKVWRTGANETTTIEFSAPVNIEGKPVPKGKYALFTIPGETDWTIIVNTGIKWGAFDYKESEDITRVTVKAGKTESFVETFNIAIVKNQVVMKWENTEVAFKISK